MRAHGLAEICKISLSDLKGQSVILTASSTPFRGQ